MFKKWFGKKKSPRTVASEDLAAARKPPRVMSITLEGNHSDNLTRCMMIEQETLVARPDATAEHVQKLTDLYTIAIEHYNSISDQIKQNHYQGLLTKLLTRDNIKHHLQSTVIGGTRKDSKVEDDEEVDGYVDVNKMQEQQITGDKFRERQKFQNAMTLTVFNAEQQVSTEPEKEKVLEEHKRKQEEAIKVVEKEQLIQQEQMKKRLAERKRISSQNRSMSSTMMQNQVRGLLSSMNTGVKKVEITLDSPQVPTEEEQKNETPQKTASDEGGFFNTFDTQQLSKMRLGNRLNTSGLGPRLSRQLSQNVPSGIGSGKKNITQMLNNSACFSDNRSNRTTGGGLANRLTFALSRVAWTLKNCTEEDKEEISEMENTLQEFNSLSDLTVKANSLSKVIKILDVNDEVAYGQPKKGGIECTSQSVKDIVEKCRIALEALTTQKDKEVEDYLEQYAEEKVQQQHEIKTKYNKMATMVKVASAKTGADPMQAEEKLRGLEEKRRQEELELNSEFADKKQKRVKEIKDSYNQQAEQITIDIESIKEAMRTWSKYSPQAMTKQQSNEQDTLQVEMPGEYGLDAMNSDYKANHRESTGQIGERRR